MARRSSGDDSAAGWRAWHRPVVLPPRRLRLGALDPDPIWIWWCRGLGHGGWRGRGFVGACRPLGTMGVPAATRARRGDTGGRGGHLLPEMAGQRLGDRISRSIILSRLRVGETWLPVKTEPTAGDGGVLAVTLMKASSCNYCRPTRAAPGETLGSGVLDQTMAALRCRFSLGSIVCGAALDVRGRRWSGFVLHGASGVMSSHA